MLADEFIQQDIADQHDWVCRLNVELERVVTKIRGLPGLSRFLLSSESLFPDLQQAAREGPVINVNASKYGCDALVLSAGIPFTSHCQSQSKVSENCHRSSLL
ncbi:hypothetical protein J3R82DRAFT_6430 [Butyriboletus roseoflavus]|nr:hypothetical protein J3R82DRAFT_6430 [Butyriboletus roseoflavus]